MGSLILALAEFSQQRAAGDIAREESKVAILQEEVALTARERDRKSKLADALASQNASAGARGVAAFEGSPLTILKEDVRREDVASKRDVLQSQISQLTTKARGIVAQRTAKTKANIGLIRKVGKAVTGTA